MSGTAYHARMRHNTPEQLTVALASDWAVPSNALGRGHLHIVLQALVLLDDSANG